MTIRAKILGGFLISFAFGLILGIIGFVSANTLTGMSNDLYTLQNESNSVSNVLNAHYIWRQSLTEAVLNGTDFTGSLDPSTCALGKWKNSDEAKSVDDAEILSLLSQIDTSHTYIHNEAATIVELIKNGNTNEAKRILTEEILPQTAATIQILTSMSSRYETLTNEKSTAIVNSGNIAKIIIIAFIFVSIISCILLGWLVISSIMKPLRKITTAAEAISIGNLNVDVNYNVNDQIGDLAKSFQKIVDSTKEQVQITQALANGDLTVAIKARSEYDAMNTAMEKMIDNLNDMFGQINTATVQVSAGSRQISDGSQSLAQGATEQSAVVQELSASISEITDKTNKNATIAKEAANLSDDIKKNAEKGSTQMEQMMQAVSEINDASGQIEKVIKVIDDIAFQTNILALNAAVEAARAGQHGKGFAVVAEEVRNLAAKSADAATDTGDLIKNSIEKANLGLNIATETSGSLKQIVDGINRSADIVTQIAVSSDESANAIVQINTGIEQVVQVVQQNSATAEESAAASEEMSAQAGILQELVERFQLKSSSVW